jgi:cell division protein FtsI/penicillin-binding protein 2
MIRLTSVACAAAVVVIAGLSGAGRSEPSATEAVKNFLLAWQSGEYATAAAMTTGAPRTVTRSLQAAYSQLGAENLALSIGGIQVSGESGLAHFRASFDLGRGGQPWNYRGTIRLRQVGSHWLIVWSPSVIAPGLGPHDRLAVLTTLPPRAPLLDSAGRSLIPPSLAIEIGVVPDKVRDARLTARDLARVTGLAAAEADQMSAQIVAAPPRAFLELVQLPPSRYARLRAALAKVPDITHQTVVKPLFASTVPVLTGQVGTETAPVLVQDGDSYLPGTTVGLSGLQQAFQQNLVGTPTTEIVVQNAAGQQVRVEKRWQGTQGKPVGTTINSGVERAAMQAVDSTGLPAAVVAVRSSTGQILGVARHSANGMPTPDPLIGRYQPGQAFTMVSTAAVLTSESGFGANSPVPCSPTQRVNGQTFGNTPRVPRLGKPKFSVDFAHACSTAFAALSLYLTPDDLAAATSAFGIGVPWQLPVGAFVGSMSKPSSANSQALPADAIGTGTVQVSPLDMALAAAVVDSGRWQQPSLTPHSSEPRLPARPALKSRVIGLLRQLMADSVSHGVARAARVRGIPLSGQVGATRLAGHPGMRAVWFVGFRGDVAFAVLTFSRSSSFDPAVSVAHVFATDLPPGF